MAFADTSTYTLAYAAEVTFDTPITGSGVYTLLRNTGESMNTSIESARSDEIDSTRQYTGSVQVSGMSGGSVNFQLSYGEYDEFLQAALQSPTWTAAYSDSATGVGASSVLLGVTATAGIRIGGSIRLSGLTIAAENKVYTVKSFILDTSITVEESITIVTEAITIEHDGYIENGSTFRSYSFEKNFDVGGTPNYFLLSGMTPGSLSLNLSSGSIISGEIGFQGATGVAGAASQDSGTYVAAQTNELMNSVSNVSGLTLSAVSTAGALTAIPATFQELSLSVDNSLREQNAVGFLYPQGIGSGRINVESSATLYFANRDFFDEFVVNGSVQISFVMTDGTGNAYAVMLPEVKISSHEVVASGPDSDIMASVAFSGVKDSRYNTDASIIITRINV